MSDRIALVTGTSSGIGAAVAKELLEHGWQVIGVARRTAKLAGNYRHLALDLAETGTASATIEREVGARLAERAWQRVGLVNNAALAPAGRVQKLDAGELARAYAVNTVMPLWLMGFVLRRRPEGAPVRVVNISSGAAQRPFPGLSIYCSSKAALRMAGMVVAAEVEDVGVFSYEPGVVDTEMQRATREMPLEEFPWGTTFRQYHAEGRLVAPELPAADVVKFLESERTERFVESRRT
ncbi:MAG TPA: SDR family NAD(P)-dependent oxidoreductase [Burkholderiales bacterium]|nr:SDR family NAD(P)-dependent oxidoreductase [Burkholderiales bacterium]